jgi:hypothetical protein
MITAYATGTLSTTGSLTEDFLSSPNVQGTFALQLDLNDIAAGEYIQVRAYKMVISGGTQRVVAFTAYYGVQDAHQLVVVPFDPIFNSLTDSNAVRFSIACNAASVSIPWAVLKDDALTPATSGRTLVVSAAGEADANVALISGDSTAADNAEAFFDGTGYAGTNNVIPTVTAVTTVNGLAANVVTASALATDAVTEIVNAIIAIDVDGENLQEALRIALAILAGESSGFNDGYGTGVFRDMANTKNRATVAVDADGNRTSVTLDGT